jgi:hypothetical protein
MSIFPSTVESLTRWNGILSSFYIAALVVGAVSSAGIIYCGSRLQSAANLKIAEAQVEQERLKQENSKLRLEIIEIQRKMTNRFLTDDERKTLIERLSPFKGHHIIITALTESEPRDFSNNIISVFREAGWSIQSNTIVAYGPSATPHGVICKLARHPDDGTVAVKTALQAIGIDLKLEQADAQQDSFIELTVGLKTL